MATNILALAADLDDRGWLVLHQCVRRLEDGWKQGKPPEIEPILPPPSDPTRERVLVELIKFDQENRWRAGEQQLALRD